MDPQKRKRQKTVHVDSLDESALEPLLKLTSTSSDREEDLCIPDSQDDDDPSAVLLECSGQLKVDPLALFFYAPNASTLKALKSCFAEIDDDSGPVCYLNNFETMLSRMRCSRRTETTNLRGFVVVDGEQNDQSLQMLAANHLPAAFTCLRNHGLCQAPACTSQLLEILFVSLEQVGTARSNLDDGVHLHGSCALMTIRCDGLTGSIRVGGEHDVSVVASNSCAITNTCPQPSS